MMLPMLSQRHITQSPLRQAWMLTEGDGFAGPLDHYCIWPSGVGLLVHAVCTRLQGALVAAEKRLQGTASEMASLVAQLRAAQLQASSAIQVGTQNLFALPIFSAAATQVCIGMLLPDVLGYCTGYVMSFQTCDCILRRYIICDSCDAGRARVSGCSAGCSGGGCGSTTRCAGACR